MPRKKESIRDISEVRKIIAKLDEDRQIIAEQILKELIFFDKQLNLLKKQLTDNAAVYYIEQGKQKMFVENPAAKTYNSFSQRYATLLKQLEAMLPKEAAVSDDGFDAFTGGRD